MSGKRPVIGIVGVGTVGGAVQRWFDQAGYTVHAHDPPKGIKDPGGLAAAEIVFICVPTPYTERGYNPSHLEAAVTALPEGKVVVVKSTVLPGTTAALQERFPRHVFTFNPEFLRETTPFEDFVHPDRQILGVTDRSRPLAAALLGLLPPAPFAAVMEANEAEMVKYATNAFLAAKVIFANQLHDLCRAAGIDYERIRAGLGADPRIGPSHLGAAQDGRQGYGGRCLPKDVKALVNFARTVGRPLPLLEAVDSLNAAYRGERDGGIP